MKRTKLTALILVSLFLVGCANDGGNTTSGSGSTTSETGSSNSSGGVSVSSSSTPEFDPTVVAKYMENLAKTSEADHLYLHYLGFNPTTDYYNQWDVWAWPYKPKEGEGYRFDWNGRTTSSDRLTADGNATIDDLSYATADIDLTKTYDGGWTASTKTMGGKSTNFYQNDGTTLDTQIGLQIVQSASRTSSSGFWKNDGGNLYVTLEDYALTNSNSTTSYHVFVTQDNVQAPSTTPPMGEIVDPFASDDGTNVTYGDAKYNTADWTDKDLKATSKEFLQGDNYLTSGAGVGYQIMVASFADSDGDGFGDIYGIEQKLDYLENLGVNVLWLTPIQSSDSYHGYDISDYLSVDPKYGSSVSPAALKAGKVDESTAKADYKSLIDAAHDRNMVVVMDLVLNHTSTTNKWFISSAQLNADYRGYYQWGNHETQAENINEDKYWYPYGSHVYSYYAKFGSSMPELNYAYVGTRQAVETMALNWLEFGVDGFRMDAVKHIFLNDEVTAASGDTVVMDVSESGDYSSNLTKNLNFWRELDYTVKQQYPNAFFVGENFDGHAYHCAPYYEGFDSIFDFYSYFNLTSLASSAYRNGNTGGYTGWLASFLGAYDSSSTDKWSAAKELASGDITGSTSSFKYEGNWNLKSVLNTNNKYRSGGNAASDANGFSAINGAFTSNHDIARAINRIAGDEWSLSGLENQGEVSTENYNTLDGLATLTEITELMLPGCTWIYYGDELGMTGNLQGKKSTDGYADLVYRQPMKWTSDGQVGDGSMTTGYSITGSGASVGWDNVNSTDTVKSAAEQLEDSSSHYNALAAFAKMKGTTPALIRGNFDVTAIEAGSATGQYGVVITRKLGSETYKYFVNFGNTELTIYDQPLSKIGARTAILTDASGNIKASYSAGSGNVTSSDWYIVGEGGFISGDTTWSTSTGIKMIVNDEYTGQGTEYYATDVEFSADDLWKLTNGTDWIANGWESGAGALQNGDMILVSDGYGGYNVKVVTSGYYDIYYKVYGNGFYSCYISTPKK